MRMIELGPLAVEVEAPRDLVFEMAAAVGGGSLPGEPPHWSEVLDRRGDELTVHYHLPQRVGHVDLIEQVTLHRPERIEFHLLHGPLDRVSEEMIFEAVAEGRTIVRYRGQVGHRPAVIGPAIARWVARPVYRTYMRRALAALKAAAEARAARSRVHAPGTPSGNGAGGQPPGV